MAVEKLRAEVVRALGKMGVEGVDVVLERPRNPDHGDWATNVALTLAKRLGRPPRAIADELAASVDHFDAGISAAEVAGPGFINFRLADDYVTGGLAAIVAADREYGRSDAGGGRAVVVEFVSANPTGPLHIGHGRQAALGDAVAELRAEQNRDLDGFRVRFDEYFLESSLYDSGRVEDTIARLRGTGH
ncbi:MAG TPA: hypothetical protein VE913_10345, partial [Longimicrobium sp.]|nr:hypothetical protein [Longimicrobium sp.]